MITLVIHFGAEQWDGPISVHEMLDTDDPDILSYCQNYRINLIDPAAVEEKDLGRFSTDLGEVLTLIKYSENTEMFREYALNRPDLVIDRQAARVVSTVTGFDIPISEKEEEIKMCGAMKQIIAEENAIAILKTYFQLVIDGDLTAERAAEKIGITVEDFLKKKEEYERSKDSVPEL